MTDEQDETKGGSFRRASARERKRRIESRDLSSSADSLPPETFPEEQAAMKPSKQGSLEETQELMQPRGPRPKRAVGERFPPLPEELPASIPSRRPKAVKNRPVPRRKGGMGWRDVVAIIFALATCGLLAYFVIIWNNPYSSLNPLSPPTPPPILVSETPIPTATLTPTFTSTPRPTATFTPVALDQLTGANSAGIVGTPDLTLTLLAGTPSATPPPPPFALLRTGILYRTHALSEGCNYSGIAGSVVDFDGQPLNGYTVWITGEEIDSRLTSGSDNTYGAGGFLLQVGTAPEVRAYAAQVLAPDGVTPLSEPITFLSSDICEYNITLVRFVQVNDLPVGLPGS